MITNERAIPVINLLNREKNGVLSTLSKKMGGWPFGSLTPFAMTAEGDPMFLPVSYTHLTLPTSDLV